MAERRRGPTPIDITIPAQQSLVTSSCVFYDSNASITKKVEKATLRATSTGVITFYLGVASTITGTVAWSVVTPDVKLTFPTSDKALFWKAEGEINAEITFLKISYKVGVT